jgi:hypothetical protein
LDAQRVIAAMVMLSGCNGFIGEAAVESPASPRGKEVRSAAAPPAASANDWFSPTRMTVRSGLLLHADYSSVMIVVGADNDSRIEVSGLANGKPLRGEMYVIGGHILLAKGLDFEKYAEIDTLDGPVMEVQLALKLLAAAIPGGPGQVQSPQPIDLENRQDAIEVSTRSASGAFEGPWSLTGTVGREVSNQIAFRLSFKSKSLPDAMTLSGTWERIAAPPQFADDLSVGGWRAFTIGPYSRHDANGTILDYGLQEIGRFATLREARVAAAKASGK